MVHTFVEDIGSTPTSTGLFSPSLVFYLHLIIRSVFSLCCALKLLERWNWQVWCTVTLLLHQCVQSRPSSSRPPPWVWSGFRLLASTFNKNPRATLVFFRPSFILLRHLLSRRTYPGPFPLLPSFPSASGNALVTTSIWGVLSPRIVRISVRALEFSRTPIPPPE